MPVIDFPATPTQRKVIEAREYMVFFMGPRGEGKTTTGLIKILTHAIQQSPYEWPIRWAVIRDTWENLKLTTVPSIRLCVKRFKIPAEGLDKLEPRIVRIGLSTGSGHFKPIVELNFFGLDTPDDANRLQGFEGAGAWIEEPAPAADISSGIPEDALLAVTSLRQGGMAGVEPMVLITMNPPDKDHWTIKYRDDIDTRERLRARGITIGFYEIPPGENPGVTKEYRDRNRGMLEAMGRFDLIARLVEGRVGYVQLGVAVTPEFGERHLSKVSLPIFPGIEIIRCWDFGLNPTTGFWQELPSGRINVLKSIRSPNMGCSQHIRHAVLPWLGSKGITGCHFRDIGDPNGLSPDAKDSNVSAVTAIEEMLTSGPGQPASFEPGPIPIWDRVGPIRAKLEGSLRGGEPIVKIDPEAGEMGRALGGGWHRKKLPSGVVGEIVKDEHSEHGDALGYSFGVKYPIPELIQRPHARRQARELAGDRDNRAWMVS